MDKNVITPERKAALEKELNDLQNVKRKEVIAALEYAKALGDLSENAEYHEAREAQGKLEDRIREIQYILKTNTVFSAGAIGENITVGNTVTLLNNATQEVKTFTIVGPQDADISAGKISTTSPLGSNVLGKSKGQAVLFNAPNGPVSYTVVSFS